jgi:vancomycin permeability regulator SanA
MRKKRVILRILSILLCLAVAGLCGVGLLNSIVVGTTRDRILSSQEAAELTDVDCILVLGCLVKDNGVPSDMLSDRLRRGMELYDLGASDKLLMSGDHGRDGYNEVAAMKRYALDAGAASQDVFMDHAGFSTYESLYRAADVFCAKKIIIVSQEYHLYRALYIAQKLGLDAYGVHADYRGYTNQLSRDIREVLARVKDFGTSILQPEPAYLGETIPVWGDGDLTNDDSSAFG